MGAVDLLFGVEGGGSLSGKSANLIRHQLENIIGRVNKVIPGIKITLDAQSCKDFESDITKLANHAVAEANRVQAAWNIQFPPIPLGGGGGGRGSRNPYSVFIRENSALSKAASLLKQVNSAKREWTASQSGLTAGTYDEIVRMDSALQLLIDNFRHGRMSIDDFELALSGFGEAFKDSSEMISRYGENVDVEKILKKDTIAYTNAMDKISGLSDKYQNNFIANWTAADGGASNDSYQSLFKLVEALDVLKQRLESESITFAEYRKELNRIEKAGKDAERSIRAVGEARSADSEESRNKKLKQAYGVLSTMEGNLSKWTAAKSGTSSAYFKGYESAASELRQAIKDLESESITLDEFNSKLASIQKNAAKAFSEISRAKEATGISKKWVDKDSDGYRDELEKIRKEEDKVKKYLDDYSAAGLDGAKTKDQYEGLQRLIVGFRELRQELANGMDIEEFKKRLSGMSDEAKSYARGIENANENNKVLFVGSKEQLDAIDKVNKALKTANDNRDAWNAASENEQTKDAYADIEKRITALNDLKTALDSGKLSAKQFAEQYDAIEHGLNQDYSKIQLKGMDHSKQQDLEKYQKALSEINAQIEKNESNLKEWSSSKFQMPDAYKELEKITNELKELQRELIRTGTVSEEFKKNFTDNVSKTEKVSGKINLGGADHKSFGDSVVDVVKEMAGFIDVMDVMYEAWEIGRNMVEAVTEIDTAMTELRKVTDETEASYNAFLKEASVRAKDLGATVTDVVSSSADFARLGYDLDGASSLADAAIVYKNVGDGISDIETASSSIISTMQAFGIEAKDAMSIVDSFNAIGM